MTWTDKHGRPELIAQPFVYRGAARARVVEAPQPDSVSHHEAEAAETKGEGTAEQ